MAKQLNLLLDKLVAEGRPQIGGGMSGGVEMRTPSLMPPFCRQGNKYIHRKKIIPVIPPHKRYVELFAGSGAIFYNKEKAEENILNDLDKGVVRRFRSVKNASTDMSKYKQKLDTIPKVKKFFDKIPRSAADKLIHEIIQTCFGFSGKPVVASKGIYKPSNPFLKIGRSLDKWQDALKGVKIENKDYEAIVKKYDGVDTFFFLDPPYENTDKDFEYAQDTDFDFDRLAEVLRGIKGKFLMTINDSPNVRKWFKGFQQKAWDVPTGWGTKGNAGRKHVTRKELLISNYPQKVY